MPVLAELAKGMDPQPACRWAWNTAPDKMVYGPCESQGQFVPYNSRSIIKGRLPMTQACGPSLATSCDEAIYNRDTKDWTCSKRGAKCAAPGSIPCASYPPCVTPTSLKMWVEEFGTGPMLVGATPDGQPVWPKVEAEVPAAPVADWTTVAVYLGVGFLGVLMLMRR